MLSGNLFDSLEPHPQPTAEMRSGIIVPLTLLGSTGASIVPQLRRSQPVVCGQDEVSEHDKVLLASRLQTKTQSTYLGSRADDVIDVNVYQHVVAFNETLQGGYLSVSPTLARLLFIASKWTR